MGSNIHNIIKSEYEKRQKDAYDLLMQRKFEVFRKIPRVEEIEAEIQLSGLKYNKMLLTGNSSAGNVISELESTINRLKQEKVALLETHGYSQDYLNPVYCCSRCKDTGFIKENPENNSQVCTCYKQQLINLIYSQSNLKLTSQENFNNFNENFYPDTVDEKKYGIKKSPRTSILEIKNSCLEFIEKFKSPDVKNLLFCGPAGVGKTYMSNCIAVELMNKGITVLYQSAPVLFSTIHEYRFKSGKDEAYDNSVYKNILEVELLIIDDFGTESPSAARYAELLTILDTRYANNLVKPCKTIISTNIDIRKLYEYYDERVVSRIIGNFDLYKFAGEDIRKYK